MGVVAIEKGAYGRQLYYDILNPAHRAHYFFSQILARLDPSQK